MTWLLFGSLVLSANAGSPTAKEIEFFEKRIRPVLIQHCYKCHSNKKASPKGKLRVDSRSGLLAGGETGPAVVPGKPEKSLLLEALRYESLEMPPTGKLSDSVINDFERWIQIGMPDPRQAMETLAARRASGPAEPVARQEIDLEAGRRFWSFQPIRSSSAGAVKDRDWPRNEIDRFLLAKMEESGIRPVADAERRSLLRRAYFDLIGLPPSPSEIFDFLADTSPDAFERVVDGLLGSPHFGEHWGRHWLDVVRYADTSGGGRTLLFENAWRYRDYVFDSMNSDKPFDRFVREQIAGDVMETDDWQKGRERLIATGFLVLGPNNYELQDKDLLRMEVVDEQIDTIGKAFLGMSLGCARCHDHKFDPIPTNDYYALAGIFRSTKSLVPGNVSRFVERPLSVSREKQQAIDRHEKIVGKLQKELKQSKAESKKLETQLAELRKKSKFFMTAGIVLDDSQATLVGYWKPSTHHPTFVGKGYIHDDKKGKGKKSAKFVPELPIANEYEVLVSYTPGNSRDPKVPVTVKFAAGNRTVFLNQRRKPPIDDLYASIGKFRFEAGKLGSVILSNEKTTGHVIVDAVRFLPVSETEGETEGTKEKGRTQEDVRISELRLQSTQIKKRIESLNAELKEAKANAPVVPMAMSVMDEEETGDCHVMVRGNVRNLGPKVPRGFLSVISGEDRPSFESGSGRKELAEWIGSPDNPLTARVICNRVWHHLFGEGIVRSPDNFGTTGQPPTHPELLDWLASRFIEQGWSIKKLIREIMVSRAYRLGCDVEPDCEQVDPANRLFWRSNRKRLSAEALRDTILLVAGRLDLEPGGPAIKPKTKSEFGYDFSSNRRSVYLPAFRNSIYDLFEVFDIADPNLVMGRRSRSTLPTQALYLMNSPFVMDHARQAAERLSSEPASGIEDRIELAYLRILGRPPYQEERTRSIRYLTESIETNIEKSNRAELDAWTNFVHALFCTIDFRHSG